MEILRSGIKHKEKTTVSSEFSHAVLQDFYFSFYHSQSRSDLQTNIFAFLAFQYKDLFSNSQRGDLFLLKQNLQSAVFNLNIPLTHAHFSGNGRKELEITPGVAQTSIGGFAQMWDTELKIFEKVLYKPNWLIRAQTGRYSKSELEHSLRLSPKERLGEIAEVIVEKDIIYQRNPRPNRKNGDMHESFFRTYALCKKSTQTSRFNILYSLLVDQAQNGQDLRLKEKMSNLKYLWEENHPGEEFEI